MSKQKRIKHKFYDMVDEYKEAIMDSIEEGDIYATKFFINDFRITTAGISMPKRIVPGMSQDGLRATQEKLDYLDKVWKDIKSALKKKKMEHILD